MPDRATLLIETDWLASHLNDPTIRIVDMRGYVKSVPLGPGHEAATYLGAAADYAHGHIPGAVYLDWTKDIIDPADPVPVQIAAEEDFAATMARAGIGDDTLVIAYDAHPAAQFATRLWWALRYYGHQRVAVLNGGFTKWTSEGKPLETAIPTYPAASFIPHPQPQWRVSANEVLALVELPERGQAAQQITLLDARDYAQYVGEKRRGEGRPGHIPGALNVPREALMDDATGTFKQNAELAEAFSTAGVPTEGNVIAYCNGGVAATSVLFALNLLGREGLANYDGSWNEWGSRADLPVATGETVQGIGNSAV